jgi:hypothetical protein
MSRGQQLKAGLFEERLAAGRASPMESVASHT